MVVAVVKNVYLHLQISSQMVQVTKREKLT